MISELQRNIETVKTIFLNTHQQAVAEVHIMHF